MMDTPEERIAKVAQRDLDPAFTEWMRREIDKRLGGIGPDDVIAMHTDDARELGIDVDALETEPEDLVLTREPDGTLWAGELGQDWAFPYLIQVSVPFLMEWQRAARKRRALHRFVVDCENGTGWYVVERWKPGHEGRVLLAQQTGFSFKPGRAATGYGLIDYRLRRDAPW